MSEAAANTPPERSFRAVRLTELQAHDVWERSAEASAFNRPSYLSRLVDEVEWWGVERAGRCLAAWPLVRPSPESGLGPPPFCYYVGPMFARELREDANAARAWHGYAASFRALVEAVTTHHAAFAFSLPLGLTDLRILSWWNFDHPGQPGFHVVPRYTARVDLAAHADGMSLLGSFNSDRRRRTRQWSRVPPHRYDDVDTARILDLHDQTLRRTGGDIGPDRHRALARVADLARSGAGRIIGFSDGPGQAAEGVVILLEGPQTMNNVFNSVSDSHCRTGLSSWMTWQALLHAKSKGVRWFDMNGANSPRRADDKHSYGARAEIYFDCRFSRQP